MTACSAFLFPKINSTKFLVVFRSPATVKSHVPCPLYMSPESLFFTVIQLTHYSEGWFDLISLALLLYHKWANNL